MKAYNKIGCSIDGLSEKDIEQLKTANPNEGWMSEEEHNQGNGLFTQDQNKLEQDVWDAVFKHRKTQKLKMGWFKEEVINDLIEAGYLK
jgi:hypothetical protein